MNVIATVTILISLSLSLASAQHEWQRPKTLIPKAQLEKIIGLITDTTLAEELNIVWVWGYDANHRPGAHDYLRVRDLMTGMLQKVDKIKVDTAYLFPSKEQFEKADLVVMYLHLPQLSAQQYSDFKAYISRGGGVVALHETAIMRPPSEGKKLAECLGMSWDEGRSKWGAIFEDISIENTHEIFKGFPEELHIADEFYWHLNKLDGVKILGRLRTGSPGSSKAPLPKSALSKETSPMFWTLEKGKGRVFGTTTGHNTFSYHDPELRIVLFRAMAWAAKVESAPFMPLVFDGITDENDLVGTAETMRDWKGKRRKPPED